MQTEYMNNFPYYLIIKAYLAALHAFKKQSSAPSNIHLCPVSGTLPIVHRAPRGVEHVTGPAVVK